MLQAHQSLIQTAYGFSQLEVAEGPRQFVAQTYILATPSGERYFCKITTKPVFIAQVKNSLPSLRALHNAGCESICYPISTQTGDLYVMADEARPHFGVDRRRQQSYCEVLVDAVRHPSAVSPDAER